MYAVIDLGSNSFHLLIAELKNQHLSVVGRCSEKIQLADGLKHSGELSDDAINRGLNCLQQFKSILSEHQIREIKVVGTEAMRRAKNSHIFQQQAQSLGFNIDVISGEQEARWIFNGVCGPLPNSNKRRLTIDIGGASTEIALGTNEEILLADSNELGCVSWRDCFFSPDFNYKNNKAAAENEAQRVLNQTIAKLKLHSWDEVYASSGSAKMLSSIAYANNWSDGTITRQCITHIESILESVNSLDELKVVGLKPQRIDLLAPGMAILSAVMKALNIEDIFYSPTALREGILAEMTNRRVDYRLNKDLIKNH